ncbi:MULTISPECIES: sensor histidine kinase [Brevibacillus]|uniref:Heme sensor protein HssS n=1 Tax=Brevibacillus parabrevis TaxID=54914 RepID=A0A4Y3PMZ9_BREPA|nr:MULTISPECIES: HAMP domain-containing sensor histidine kinase [Brevibacillus]MED2253481.1 HAMP domain-containing sensor histidine kinase [Brevibacillus parabrevis]RNB97634.1 sensor histidine kinase [Brevibacillus parabrevis]WDV95779.1 HAMP domain-containing sensor histidine kinase [Brevibacillus parabrevis]GEB34783.1 two-component sensor histidine kinase [Brevibacillus parabrevis]HBZ83015.1 sensor histidine kinase [Brevibacillus sp.]
MRSLYFRVVLMFVAIVIVSGTLGFLLANEYYQRNMRTYNEQKITRIGQQIIDLYEHNAASMDLPAFMTHVANLNFQLYLVDENGQVQTFGAPFRDQQIEPQIVQKVLAGETYRGIAEEQHGLFVTGFFENTLKNSIGLPLEAEGRKYALFVRPSIEQQFGEVHVMFAVLLAAMFLLSLMFILIFTRYLVRPIQKLSQATKKLAEGEYEIQLDISRRDEIGELAANFAQMTESLKQLDDMRQEFVSNVSHEIQSPLASIQGFSQAIRSGGMPEAQKAEYLAIIEEESRRLSSLSKQLLTLASLDKETGLYEPSEYRLDEQLRQVVLLLERQWQQKKLELELELPDTLVTADKQLFNQVWINLLSNSIKFTPPHGTIFVSIRQSPDIAVIIRDTGIGISEEERQHIFERFYKGDKSRNREATGSGLGLAIVQKIVQVAKGSIEIDSQTGVGTTIKVTLPAQERPRK